jgi:hypothetical protein
MNKADFEECLICAPFPTEAKNREKVFHSFDDNHSAVRDFLTFVTTYARVKKKVGKRSTKIIALAHFSSG